MADPVTGLYPANHAAYPATMFYYNPGRLTLPVVSDSETLHLDQYALQWMNRCSFLTEFDRRPITPNTESCRNPGTGESGTGLGQVPVNQFLSAPFNFLPSMSNEDIQRFAIYPLFSTYKKANNCSFMQAMSLYGAPYEYIQRFADTRDVGLRLWYRDAVTGQPRSDVSKLRRDARVVRIGRNEGRHRQGSIRAIVDICLLSARTLPSSNTGLALDFEVFDYRNEAETLAFLRGMKNVVGRFNKKLLLASNQIGGFLPNPPVGANHHGIGRGNAFEILQTVDTWVLDITNGAGPQINSHPATEPKTTLAQNYSHMLDVLTDKGRHTLTSGLNGLRKKILVGVSIYDTTLSDARWLYGEVTRQEFGGLRMAGGWRKGGRCDRTEEVTRASGRLSIPVNQVMACLTLGVCHGHFGEDRNSAIVPAED